MKMNSANKPSEQILQKSGDETRLMGRELDFWIDRFGLPLHLCYSPVIRENIRGFHRVFREAYPRGEVRYAVKASAHPSVLRIVQEEGGGADVASYNEVRSARQAGIDPEKLVLNGNCKEDELIEEAIRENMLIIADCREEFDLIAEIAVRMGKRPRVLLRISGYNLGNVTQASVFTAGIWTKFGEPIDRVPDFIKSLQDYPQVNFMGFHTHIGSQITELKPYRAVLGRLGELGRHLNRAGIKCRVINIGGGYPVSYVDKDTWDNLVQRTREGLEAARRGDFSHMFCWAGQTEGFPPDETGQINLDKWNGEKFYSAYPKWNMLRALLKGTVPVDGEEIPTVEALDGLGGPILMVEPGRSIVEDAGITLARASHVRTISGGHNLVALEMGVTSYCDSLIEGDIKHWEILTGSPSGDDEPFETFVGGNLCFSGDMLAKYKISLPRRPKRGDILMIRATGAYSSSYMPANANSFPRPARILVDEKGKFTVMKRRDRYDDIFSQEIMN
ncbi:MAG: alanine racemase [Candidatus Eremiobacteraeota bacterium]|nr:alanine racemase [Candidatus Eremiobacteraeota bacterium]